MRHLIYKMLFASTACSVIRESVPRCFIFVSQWCCRYVGQPIWGFVCIQGINVAVNCKRRKWVFEEGLDYRGQCSQVECQSYCSATCVDSACQVYSPQPDWVDCWSPTEFRHLEWSEWAIWDGCVYFMAEHFMETAWHNNILFLNVSRFNAVVFNGLIF